MFIIEQMKDKKCYIKVTYVKKYVFEAIGLGLYIPVTQGSHAVSDCPHKTCHCK